MSYLVFSALLEYQCYGSMVIINILLFRFRDQLRRQNLTSIYIYIRQILKLVHTLKGLTLSALGTDCRRQILMYKVDPRIETITIFLISKVPCCAQPGI